MVAVLFLLTVVPSTFHFCFLLWLGIQWLLPLVRVFLGYGLVRPTTVVLSTGTMSTTVFVVVVVVVVVVVMVVVVVVVVAVAVVAVVVVVVAVVAVVAVVIAVVVAVVVAAVAAAAAAAVVTTTFAVLSPLPLLFQSVAVVRIDIKRNVVFLLLFRPTVFFACVRRPTIALWHS